MTQRFLLSTVSAFLVAAPFTGPAQAQESLPPLASADAPAIEVAQNSEQASAGLGELSAKQKAVAAALTRGRYQGISVAYPQGLRDFYKSRQYKTVWTNGDDIDKRDAKAALDVLERSWTHGLAPDTYHVRLLRQMASSKLDEGQALDFEILLSDAVARYGHDVTGMRVDPKALGEDTNSWSRGLDAEQVLIYVAEGNPGKAMNALAPNSRLYERMREELVAIVKDIVENPNADPVRLSYTRTLRPGDRDAMILRVRERLNVQAGQDGDLYDDKLARDVAKFQRASGLKADAILGRRTFAALNQGRKDRLIKLIANMERQRWMDRRMPERYIVVNVPAMTLWAIEGNRIALEMPVVVGREKRATNSFITNITGIRFNPSWNVPDTIKTEDYLPALQADPQALKKKGIELIHYTSDGYETIDPASIDWASMTPQTIKAVGMIQNPGDDNALGRIRVLMPNKYNIYLHDTNSPELFRKDFRALSSGCIRLAEPEKVANFILSPNRNWSDEKMAGYLEKTKTVEVRAEKTLPVFILYQTIWLDDGGEIVYGDDLYGNDLKLIKELKRIGQLDIPINLI